MTDSVTWRAPIQLLELPIPPEFGNDTARWQRESWGAFGINLLPLAPFLALTCLVIAQMIGRSSFRWLLCCHACRRRSSGAADASKKDGAATTAKSVHLLSWALLIHCIYHLVVSVVYALSDLWPVAWLNAICGVLLFYHFTSFCVVAVFFLSTWLAASKSFHLFIRQASKGGSADDVARVERLKLVLRRARIAAYVMLGLDGALFTFMCTVCSVTYCLSTAGVITETAHVITMGVLLPVWVFVAVSMGLIAILVGAQLVSGLRTVTRNLARSQTTANKALMKRVALQKVTIVKLSLGIIAFALHMMLLIVGGLLWVFIHRTGDFIVGAILNLLFLRTLPTFLIVSAMLAIFWPYPLPEALLSLCMCGARVKESTRRELLRFASRPMLVDTGDDASTSSYVDDELKSPVPTGLDTPVADAGADAFEQPAPR